MVLNDLRMYAFERGSDSRSTRYLRVRMLDASGVAHYSTLYQDFDPLWEKVFVNQLVVRDAAGQIVLTGSPADYYVVNKSDAAIVSHRRTLCIPVPHLLPGHTVELVLTKSALGLPDDFDFARLWLVQGQPMLLAGAGYGGALSNIQHAAFNGVQTTATPSGCVWQVTQSPAFEPEPLEAGRETFLPLLLLADGAGDWQRAADTYLGKIAAHLQPERPVQALAQRLTAGATNTAARIRCICEYVQTNFTYRGIEFGVRGRVPPPVEETLRNRYGDCKEHALLTVTLLRAAGIAAQPALVHTSWPIVTNLPSMDQFNHMLAYVPEGNRFLDTTEKNTDITAGIPAGLGGRQALVLAPGAAHFATIGAHRVEDCSVATTATALLGTNGVVRVQETTVFSGYYAAAMRDWLRGESTDAGHQWAQDSLRRYEPAAELVSFKAEPLATPAATLTFTADYTLPARASAAPGQHALTPPAWWLKYYFQTSPATHRQHPFGLEFPLHVVSTLRIQSADGRAALAVPAPEAAETEGLVWRVSARRDGVALVLTADGQNKTGRFPRAAYDRYRQSTDRLLRAATPEITFGSAP